MLYALAAVLILIILTLALAVRVRVVWEDPRRTAAVTLGRRTGVMLDFANLKGSLRLAGFSVYTFPIDLEEKTKEPGPKKPKKKRRKLRKQILSKDMLRFLRENLPRYRRAFWGFIKGVFKATVIEEANARVEAGFDSPDQTGIAYGYYQAALGMIPVLAGRVQFVPDWIGPSFNASGRIAMAIPLYKLLWNGIVLFWRLPSIKTLRMAIKQDKGDKDAK